MITTSTEPAKVIEAMVKGTKELGLDQDARKEYVLATLSSVDSNFVLDILSEVEGNLS